MILLQASFLADRLLLWGETPAPTPTNAKRKLRKTAAALPFAADPTALTESMPRAARPADPQAVFAWLPTQGGQPLASSPLIAEPPELTEAPALAAWGVSALPLEGRQAVDLLAGWLDRDTLAPGLRAGVTLRFWADALRFAGALVAREQFLPGLRHGADGWSARWEPTIAGQDGQRFAGLARAMPAACRALATTAESPPNRPAAAVLADFLALAVDALVRSANGAVVRSTRPKTKKPAYASLHDQWLAALRSDDGRLRDDEAALTEFAEQVRSWHRPLAVSAAAPFRLCFRLEEPPAPDGEPSAAATQEPWIVRYLLQAQDDPSLLVPAGDAWKPRGANAAVFQRAGFRPREFLLASLGQAAGVCAPVEASLRTADPAGFETNTVGAHLFLTEAAGALRQAGFGVLLPSWWTGHGTRQKLTLTAQVKTPKLRAGSGLSLASMLEFDWRVAIGDQKLSLRELEALARLKTALVRVRGQWVQVSAEEIAAALAFLKKQATGQATAGELVRMALGAAGPGPGGVAVAGVEATGWFGDLLRQLQGEASFAELPAPPGFRGSLRPYQLRGYSWLAFLSRWGLGACLADDMGLGKTVQTLAFVQKGREGGERRPTLLICPMSVVGNWKKEAERFTPDLPVLVHHGQKRTRDAAFVQEAGKHALVLSSYALLHRDADLLQKVDWAGVVLDEAQNIKNAETRAAQAARALKADHRIALTGTPVENHVGDLWSISQFLNPGLLGTRAAFRRSFLVPIQVQRDPAATERLKRLTGPFLLRRLKTDPTIIADLPEKQEAKVYCNLTKEQVSLYEAVVKELDREMNEADGIRRKGLILGALSKLKQVCNHPAQFLGDQSEIAGRSGKLARLTEMLDEVLQANDRALVFTQFTEMGDILRKHLQETFGIEVLFLHGGTSAKQRDRMVTRFQEAGGPRIFLLSLKAGGTGLNLTAANHVFHFDRWWNPAVENQATDRAFRIGQKRNVQVHKFICVGTLEERIDEMIESKREVAARVVGEGEGWLTELSNDQLKNLVKLRQEALGE
jgi:superfamily II DNA or RNA helicase